MIKDILDPNPIICKRNLKTYNILNNSNICLKDLDIIFYKNQVFHYYNLVSELYTPNASDYNEACKCIRIVDDTFTSINFTHADDDVIIWTYNEKVIALEDSLQKHLDISLEYWLFIDQYYWSGQSKIILIIDRLMKVLDKDYSQYKINCM